MSFLTNRDILDLGEEVLIETLLNEIASFSGINPFGDDDFEDDDEQSELENELVNSIEIERRDATKETKISVAGKTVAVIEAIEGVTDKRDNKWVITLSSSYPLIRNAVEEAQVAQVEKVSEEIGEIIKAASNTFSDIAKGFSSGFSSSVGELTEASKGIVSSMTVFDDVEHDDETLISLNKYSKELWEIYTKLVSQTLEEKQTSTFEPDDNESVFDALAKIAQARDSINEFSDIEDIDAFHLAPPPEWLKIVNYGTENDDDEKETPPK